MSDFDYSRPLATATRLIARFGRLVSFSKTAVLTVDPANPLKGPASATPVTVSDVKATFVEPSSLMSMGINTTKDGLWKDCTQICLVAADGVNDFSTFMTIEDSDGTVWKIARTSELKPGDTSLLYFVGVKR